jgi:hypothetical protein
MGKDRKTPGSIPCQSESSSSTSLLSVNPHSGYLPSAPLAGVYDLRIADAHLPSANNIADAMKLVGIRLRQKGTEFWEEPNRKS